MDKTTYMQTIFEKHFDSMKILEVIQVKVSFEDK
jgi:hypothetical protein